MGRGCSSLGATGGTVPLTGGTATLYVNGTVNAAVVTLGTVYPYSWSVTLPALTGRSSRQYVRGGHRRNDLDRCGSA